ncbi:MAG: hypothetical protein HXY41_15690 [Chloroflexi bacterium]|nr:hypothetical protein [Chloroflexota bacterium]
MSRPDRLTRVKNLSYAGVAGLAGCFITVIVVAALLAGLWLDARFGLRGPFTVGLVVLSVPVTLWLVVRIVLRLVNAIQTASQENHQDTNTSLF